MDTRLEFGHITWQNNIGKLWATIQSA